VLGIVFITIVLNVCRCFVSIMVLDLVLHRLEL